MEFFITALTDLKADHARRELITKALRLHATGLIDPSQYSNKSAYVNVLIIAAMMELIDEMKPSEKTELGRMVAKQLANLTHI